MTNPYLLTIAAILLTLDGQAPVSIWFPLFEDIARNFANIIMNVLEVLM